MMIDGWAVLGSSKLPLFLTFSGASLPSDLQISKAAFATQLMPCWSSSNGTGHVLGVPCKTWSSITRSLVSPRMCAFCFPNEIYWICFSKGACLFFQVWSTAENHGPPCLMLKSPLNHWPFVGPPTSSYQSLTIGPIGHRAVRTWRRGIASFRSFSGFATTACRRGWCGCLRNVGTCVAPKGWRITGISHDLTIKICDQQFWILEVDYLGRSNHLYRSL